jgi:hypothetical protein
MSWPRGHEDAGAEPSAPHGHGRLTVLETTPVDSRRKLLLVRCDDVEHLIMVGGPADLVVEHDIRRRPATAAPVALAPAVSPSPAAAAVVRHREEAAKPREAEVNRAVRPALPPDADATANRRKAMPPETALPPPAKPEAAPRPTARPEALQPARTEPLQPTRTEPPQPARTEAPQPAPVRPALAAVPPSVGSRVGGHAASPDAPVASASAPPVHAAAPATSGGPDKTRRADTRPATPTNGASGGPAEPRPPRRGTEIPQPRRETLSALRRAQPAATARSTSASATPSAEPVRLQPVASRDAAAGERRPRTGRDANGGGNGQDAAKPGGLPAAQVPWPDTDSVETEIVQALNGGPVRAPAEKKEMREPAKTKTDSTTTLGDLADRLEEALAREVQAANPSRSRLDLNLDAFGFGREKSRERTEPKLRSESTRPAPAAEPEARQESRPAPERQEETPVISLNTRRREPVDPLEDEMARLLGELTGDTGRR